MKVNSLSLVCAASILSTVALASAARANLVTNGDFSANAAAYQTFPGYNSAGSGPTQNPAAPTGWNPISQPTTQGINGPDVTWDTSGGHSKTVFGPSSNTISNALGTVNDFLFLQHVGYTSPTQVTATTAVALTANTQYTLSFDIAGRTYGSQGYLRLVVSDAANTLVDTNPGNNSVAGDYAPSSSAWTHETLTFTAGATGAGVLQFTNDYSLINYTLDSTVDVANVVLEPIPVPEPASLSLIAIGTAALLRRRK